MYRAKSYPSQEPLHDILECIGSGGGMRGAFGAGAFKALAGKARFDKLRLISANAGNGSYFVANQMHYADAIWTEALCGSEFISGNHICIDYLVDDVFTKKFPLDTDAIRESSTEIIIPALSTDTGKVRYFSSREHPEFSGDEYNHWYKNVIRAAMAHPLAFRKEIVIDGERYIDGGFGCGINQMAELALQDMPRRIIIIDNENGTSLIDRAYARMKLKGDVQRTVLKRLRNDPVLVPDNVDIIHISSKGAPASLLCNDPTKIDETIKYGEKMTLAHPGLREYFREAA